jgi:single-strand DNA-binding protein
MSINRAILVGRLTKDPDLRYTPNGIAVCNFTIAVNRTFKQDGQQQADFIQIQVWRKQAENAATYLKKGSLAGIDGRIQTRRFEGQNGKTVFVTEVVADSVQFLEPKGSQNGNNQSVSDYESTNQYSSNNPFQNSQEPIEIQDDDLPF